MASWLVEDGTITSHRTIDQLRVGEGLVRLVGTLSSRASNTAFLKWPNDLWIQTEEGRLSKAGGVLFEAVTQGSRTRTVLGQFLIDISEPTRLLIISYAVFCSNKKISKRVKHYFF